MAGTFSRDEILKQLRDLAFGRCNDAVKLAFLGKEDISRVGKLDLQCLESVHTAGNGGIEIKLVDRAELIRLLLAATEEKTDPAAGAGRLIAAIDGAADRLGEAAPHDLP